MITGFVTPCVLSILEPCPYLCRHLIQEKESGTDPTQIARLVEYVRKQVLHMDAIDSKELLDNGTITMLPFTDRTSANQSDNPKL